MYDGQTLKKALKSAERILERQIDEINSLNVFPVPDGDTGINMFLTMQSATAAIENVFTNSAAEISARAARGALIGARGNSGVILSQILRGIAKGMEMKERFTSSDFAHALRCASDTAYKAIAQPVEGTILTVIREASEAAMKRVEQGASLKQTMAAITSQARKTVKKTPDLLPQLQEAGVVDAGGKGLLYVFQGMKNAAAKETEESQTRGAPAEKARTVQTESRYGYDLQFLIEGTDLQVEEMREHINGMGEAVLVVGDENLVRVHIHTQQTQAVMDYCSTRGCLKDITIEDLDEQVKRFNEQSQAQLQE